MLPDYLHEGRTRDNALTRKKSGVRLPGTFFLQYNFYLGCLCLCGFRSFACLERRFTLVGRSALVELPVHIVAVTPIDAIDEFWDIGGGEYFAIFLSSGIRFEPVTQLLGEFSLTGLEVNPELLAGAFVASDFQFIHSEFPEVKFGELLGNELLGNS